MRKSLKIPVSVTILIAALFAFQSFIILNLSQKEDTSEDLLGLIRQETQIRALFLAGQDLPSSVIYKFAVYDANFKPVFSTLTKEPSDFKFSVLSQDGYLYYKSFFLKNSVPFFIVTAKAQDYSKAIFLTSLTLTMLLAALFFTLYLFYVSSVKPYKQMQKYMNNFFNDAMHELKTPLGVAGINLEMSGANDKYAVRIKNALKQMQLTYEDVEYFIKKGYINFPKESLALGAYILERAQFLSSLAQAKNIELITNVDTDCRTLISKLAAQRIIDNTLTNAIKYSPKDTKILINFAREGEEAVFSVQDFGIGIKDVKRIWLRYEREDTAQGGFGLGLNIVAEICLKEGIGYGVVSELGKGSTFSYRFKIINA